MKGFFQILETFTGTDIILRVYIYIYIFIKYKLVNILIPDDIFLEGPDLNMRKRGSLYIKKVQAFCISVTLSLGCNAN